MNSVWTVVTDVTPCPVERSQTLIVLSRAQLYSVVPATCTFWTAAVCPCSTPTSPNCIVAGSIFQHRMPASCPAEKSIPLPCTITYTGPSWPGRSCVALLSIFQMRMMLGCPVCPIPATSQSSSTMSEFTGSPVSSAPCWPKFPSGQPQMRMLPSADPEKSCWRLSEHASDETVFVCPVSVASRFTLALCEAPLPPVWGPTEVQEAPLPPRAPRPPPRKPPPLRPPRPRGTYDIL
mmetsp:Transcript_14494/g.36721  ORF Transcript_14494/g.36721 Transcript_14494/m.36721 type:complete len:235 (-) Transcript_14494:106-810(-)